MPLQDFFSQPFGVQWRTALVRLPRAVPSQILKYTSPHGPHPVIINLPSRGAHKIPVYLFIPTLTTTTTTTATTSTTAASPTQPSAFPVILDFHGGSFVLGSCLEQAPFCAKLARELGALVISVDYRLGPIVKFPAAIEDGEDVLSAVVDPVAPGYRELREAVEAYLRKNGGLSTGTTKSQQEESDRENPRDILDTTHLSLSGFSSGGNLALNLALSLHAPSVPSPWPSRLPPSSTHPHPIPLLLFYPSLDARQLPSQRPLPAGMPPSTVPKLLSDLDDVLMPTYLPREQAGHLRASPGLADVGRELDGRAKVFLVLPEWDSLADQSEVWVKKMGEGGRKGDLNVRRCKGMKHGWTQMPESWLGEEEKRMVGVVFGEAVGFVGETWGDTESLAEGK